MAATIGVLGILAASIASVQWIHAVFLIPLVSRGALPAILTKILLGAASVVFGLAVVLLAYLPFAAAALALFGLVFSMVKHRGITAGA
ncbi:hypothetical protein [Leucobacter luti]|uniref:hypothetical protein n=1 Tax=Leucobacter luti TaxID=340320 RepID=UPI003D093372